MTEAPTLHHVTRHGIAVETVRDSRREWKRAAVARVGNQPIHVEARSDAQVAVAALDLARYVSRTTELLPDGQRSMLGVLPDGCALYVLGPDTPVRVLIPNSRNASFPFQTAAHAAVAARVFRERMLLPVR